MTITEWVDSLGVDAAGHVTLEQFADGGKISIDATVLAGLLSAVTSVPPTHAELSALPIAVAGWQPYFDDWKAKGFVL